MMMGLTMMMRMRATIILMFLTALLLDGDTDSKYLKDIHADNNMYLQSGIVHGDLFGNGLINWKKLATEIEQNIAFVKPMNNIRRLTRKYWKMPDYEFPVGMLHLHAL